MSSHNNGRVMLFLCGERERERERERESVCVCVCEGEREDQHIMRYN